MEKNEYEKLRIEILESLIEQRGIKCRKSKSDMVKHLILDDNNQYIRDTIYEKLDRDIHLIGVDVNNHDDLTKIGRLLEKNEVKYFGLYQLNRIYFTSKEKIEL